jgi:HlyD family secretion protein
MRSSSLWLSGIVLLVVVIGGTSMYLSRDTASAAVRLAAVERAALVSSLTTNGKVEPVDTRELRALTPGLIGAVTVREGDRVRAGQPLVQMDRTESSAEVARVEAEIRAAEGDLQNIQHGGSAAENVELQSAMQKARLEKDEATRQLGISQRLAAKRAAPRAEVDAAQERLRRANQEIEYLDRRRTGRFSDKDTERARARLDEAQAALVLAQQRLNSASAASPIGGVVFSLPVARGNFVNRGDLLAKIADLSKLRVKVYVDEPELGRVAAGQDVMVTWDAAPGESWKGKVDRMPAEVSLLGTRSVGLVECVIDNSNGKLIPNVNVNVEIVGRRSDSALTLPKDAVSVEAGNHFVFLYENGPSLVKRHLVTLGISTANRVEILQGLSDGQQVAIAIDRKLADGMKVKP